jgi:hypothetical protein
MKHCTSHDELAAASILHLSPGLTMPKDQAKVKATSRKVTSYQASYLADGTIKTSERQRGPRQISEAKADIKMQWGAVLQRM